MLCGPMRPHTLRSRRSRIISPSIAICTEVHRGLRRKIRVHADQSWKGSGTCTWNFKDGDKVYYDSWEEGSQLKEYTYKTTGGTGKYQGAKGGGTYIYENLTDTLGGAIKGKMELP